MHALKLLKEPCIACLTRSRTMRVSSMYLHQWARFFATVLAACFLKVLTFTELVTITWWQHGLFYRRCFYIEYTIILPLLNIFCFSFLTGNSKIFDILTPVTMKMVILSFWWILTYLGEKIGPHPRRRTSSKWLILIFYDVSFHFSNTTLFISRALYSGPPGIVN
jgi:hypothetical protein